jgi:hypothetical protein
MMTSPTPSWPSPAQAWTAAYDVGRPARPGAWVAEITGTLNLSSWPKGYDQKFTSTGVVYGVADPVVTGLPVAGVSA